MAYSLASESTSITLPADLIWMDRNSWSPVEQTVETSITGAALIDVAGRLNGRPITLAGSETHAWMHLTIVDQLRAWAADAGRELTLTIDSMTFEVVFRHQDKPALDVSPVVDYAQPASADFYFGTLKFMEI